MAWLYESGKRALPLAEPNRDRCANCATAIIPNENPLPPARGMRVLCGNCRGTYGSYRDQATARLMQDSGKPHKRDQKGILKRYFGSNASKAAIKSGKGWKKSR